MNVNPFSYLIEKLKGYVSKSGDTVFGDLTVNAENGTANVDAYTYLKVGNQTPKSSAKHSTGLLRLCGENGKYTDIYAPNSTASRDIVFPNASGTVALTSDIPSDPATVKHFDTENTNTYTVTIPPIGRHNFLIITQNDVVSVVTKLDGAVVSAISMKGLTTTVSGNDVTVHCGDWYRSVMLIY